MERRKREKRDKERIIGGLYLPSDDNDKFPSVITRSMLENVISRIDRIFSFNFFFFLDRTIIDSMESSIEFGYWIMKNRMANYKR